MIKVNFVMGYLGSGKTTFIQSFLNSLPAKDERILLVVNDFGKVNYDALALEEHAPEIKAITYGCICCDLRIQFRDILVECGERQHLDRVLIEPSGILIPDVITDLFEDQAVSTNLQLEPLIHIVDVTLINKIQHKLPPFIKRQIAISEKIVLNRVEEITAHELLQVKAIVKAINSRATYYTFIKDQNADHILLGPGAGTVAAFLPDEFSSLDSHPYQAVQTVERLQFRSQDELKGFLAKQGPGLLRAKGVVEIHNKPFLVNYTVTQFSVLPCPHSFQTGLSLIFNKDRSRSV